jgi:purine-binding chemotaxis protein CheW
MGTSLPEIPANPEASRSDRILDEIKRHQQRKDVVDVEEERVKVVIFSCAGTRFTLYGSDVREILPPREISWVPCLPSHIPGLINVRGDIESVVDIRPFLGFEPADAQNCFIAMAVHGSFCSGILIDAVEDVTDVPLTAIKPPLATLGGIARELVAGELEHEKGMAILLDIEKLIARITL